MVPYNLKCYLAWGGEPGWWVGGARVHVVFTAKSFGNTVGLSVSVYSDCSTGHDYIKLTIREKDRSDKKVR